MAQTGFLVPEWYVVEAPSDADMNVASIIWGFSLAVSASSTSAPIPCFFLPLGYRVPMCAIPSQYHRRLSIDYMEELLPGACFLYEQIRSNDD